MDTSTLETQATLAVAMPYLLQWLKGRAWFPFMSYTSGTMNRWMTALIAFLTSLGIHTVYDASAGTILISGLTLAGIAGGVQHAALQWAGQHFVYKALIAPPLAGATQAASRAEPTAVVLEPMVDPKAPDQGPAKDPK